MGTQSVDLVETVGRLSAGTQQWMRLHAGYLNSPAAHEELPVTPRVKALLQLGLLCRYWKKAAPDDTALDDVTAVVKRAWQSPDFPGLLARDPNYAQQFELMYAALAPAGAVTGTRAGALDRLAAVDYLAPRRKPPYLHLSTRFYADVTGTAHRLAPYRELYETSLLARAAALPVAGLDACQITHTLFYLSDFGFRDPGLTEEEREQGRLIVDRLTDHCVREGEWDYVGKLLLAQYCLGVDPTHTASGAAGFRMLAQIQSPDGAIPGKSAALRAAATATPVEFFRRAYQATLVTALTTLVVTSGRVRKLSAAQATAGWEAR